MHAPIPAMTSEAERECYYRLALEAEGAVIEFGTWLGASTAYIAAAIRDKGGKPAHTYDKFRAQQSHVKKVREFYNGTRALNDSHSEFVRNMGPLIAHVEAHKGEITEARWGDEPIGLIVFDAPKRVPAISAVLTNFRNGIRPGTMTAWQDFCHFPSYEIPACLYRIRDRLEFTEAVVPGSTMCFRVKSVWDASEVTPEALALHRWTPDAIADAWAYWLQFVPAEKAELFKCGAAMFLCDIGHPHEAVKALEAVNPSGTVGLKWEYLRENRPDFVKRYAPLFAVMEGLAHAC